MAPEYKNYLATSILNEDRVITYRQLSRALKVHVNTAKEMLYEFHRVQNGKKPGSVHATYLVAGKKHAEEAPKVARSTKDCGDEYMRSSPFRSSPVPRLGELLENSSVLSITLIREEDLEDLQSQYETISSIHIFSLGSYRLKDLQVLSDATREALETCSSQDPLQSAWTHGTITNKNVKRRSGRKPSVPALPTTTPSKSSSLMPTSFGEKGDQSIQSKPSTSKPVAGSSQFIGEPSAKGAMDKKANNSKPPQLKRDSNIFKSFAKATPILKREETDSSVAASDVASAAPSVQADVEMNASEDEDNYVVPSQPPSCPTEVSRKSRKEIKAELSKMMDTDSEGESKVIPERQASAPGNPSDQLTEESVHVTDGRRRGRRMVMKKKTFEDEEGFRVTKEEPVWESFSEDESVVQKPKVRPPSGAKAKRASSKPGQGSIMSFFGKKT